MNESKMTHGRKRLALGALCAACFITMSGCLVTGSNYTKVDGRYIGPDTISRIEIGETDETWLMAVLGEPTSRSELTTGETIWRWEYNKVKRSSGSLFLIFRARDRTEVRSNVYVKLEEGVVTDVWSD